MPEIKKIVLGTAQFGMDYGINNRRGRIPQDQTVAILDRALKAGIDTIDTASVYGDSEKILGNFMKTRETGLKIISKLAKRTHREAKDIINTSLHNLGISRLHGYLIHNFEDYKKDKKLWEELENMKKEGKTEKIGFSLYFPRELEQILEEGLKIDLVQLPLSIFDQRFEPYLPDLRRRKIAIYARSVFLQGLVFKAPAELSGNFADIKDKIEQLNFLSERHKISIFALCLNFAILNNNIDKVVLGVDSLGHLERNIGALSSIEGVRAVYDDLLALREDDEDMIVPTRWSAGR